MAATVQHCKAMKQGFKVAADARSQAQAAGSVGKPECLDIRKAIDEFVNYLVCHINII